MVERKYAVVPDFIIRPGKKEVFVSGKQLMDLYGVEKEECIVVLDSTRSRSLGNEYTVLRPRADGDYTLPERI